ncbi:hypothetical protein GYMLUDRAFT_242744 [Collybiopsis luxurians FD-317 M1]|uniref:Uncharacterized protein n=1 Tax=Collybiopsis luxurians FD-317 M1 TaxID=944289 RepID=A0A0D0D0Q4_9AGAR|nr:hypothetical protein GYMLUDRAFT_242744 [Collybiopsis luxurians FD-317 M1]
MPAAFPARACLSLLRTVNKFKGLKRKASEIRQFDSANDLNPPNFFCYGIIRGPIKGLPATCPIGSSLSSPELNLPIWLASPQTTILNLLHAKHIPTSSFPRHPRVVISPGFTITIRDEIEALRQVGGEEAVKLIKFEDDPETKRLVDSWPRRFDNSYALSLGFVVDEGGMVPIVERFKKDVEAGLA